MFDLTKIDKDSYVPLYRQLYDIICYKISTDVYKLGSLMPTQKEIAVEYNVSLIIVKKVWDKLVDEHIICSVRGKGTIVNKKPKVIQYTHTYKGISADINGIQVKVRNKILDLETVTYEQGLHDGLKLDPGFDYLYISRVRYFDDTPFNLEKIYINKSFFPNIQITANILEQNSLYKTLDVNITGAVEKIEPILAVNEICDYLNIKINTPILTIRRRAYINNDKLPFEYCRYYSLPKYFGEISYGTNQIQRG